MSSEDDFAYQRGTTEFIAATVTANVTLDTQVVQIAVSHGSTHSWLDAHWIGSAGTTRTARTDSPITFADVGYPGSRYGVYVKVTDSPEAPILRVGTITIT